MWFEKQPETIVISNLDERLEPLKQTERRHGKLFPNTLRCIICGPSNCGKTNLIISLLEDPNGLRFENVYVYSKSLYQPKYVYLAKLFEDIKDVGIGYHPYDDNQQVIPPEEARTDSVFIFSDVACEKQDNIIAYFSMGRHNNIEVFTYARRTAEYPSKWSETMPTLSSYSGKTTQTCGTCMTFT